jgi:hypothetical protein
MFEQLTQLVQQFGEDAVVKNSAIPNEHNEAVMKEAGNSIFASLQKMALKEELSNWQVYCKAILLRIVRILQSNKSRNNLLVV